MPKKNFQYKTVLDLRDVWYTDNLKGWFIVKEQNQYFLRKGSIYKNTLELGNKRFKSYQRLGDAKVGLENYCKDYVQSLKKQQEIFDELQKNNQTQKTQIDYNDLDKQVERLKEKWGIRQRI